MTTKEAIKFAEYAQIMADGKPDVQEFYKIAEAALRSQQERGWISVEDRLPEDLPENKGKKVIPCLVSLKSTYPKGKPNTQKRQRQLQYYGSAGWVWEWSRIGSSRVTHWMSLPGVEGLE